MDDVDAELAGAWQALVPLFMAKRDQFFAAMAELGITPPHGHALMSLSEPRRMSELAESMACDASYITVVVDRLEELGLAERRASQVDRRVKRVALTPKGRRAVTRLQAAMGRPPEVLSQLSATDRRSLARILRKIAPAAAAGAPAGPALLK